MKIQLQLLAYGFFFLTTLSCTVQSKLSNIPEFSIEPEFPITRSHNIPSHSTKITFIFEETTAGSEKAPHVPKEDEDNEPLVMHNLYEKQPLTEDDTLQPEDCERVATLSLFADLAQSQKIATMINALFDPLERFITQALDQVEAAVGPGEVSSEESCQLLESIAASMLMRSGSAETTSYESAAEYTDGPLNINNTQEFNTFLTTTPGQSMMAIFNLYHLVLYEIAYKQVTTTASPELEVLTSAFKTLEAQFAATVEAKLPVLEMETMTTIQEIRTMFFEALKAGREFLHAERCKLWSDTLTIAAVIATRVQRPVEELVLLDFVKEANKVIITV